MDNKISVSIKQLLEYLNLTYNEFAKECGFSTYLTVKNIVEGRNPTFNTLAKIRKRYPVREEWLLLNKGDMWEKDYFEDRFEKFSKNYNTTQEKMQGLLNIYETNKQAFSRKTGVQIQTIAELNSGLRLKFSKKVRDKILDTFPHIPETYFD